MPDTPQTAFLFDLDGTLVDSVYEHVLAWHDALSAEGIPISVWRIHRKIGMSGGLFTNILLRETGLDITQERLERLRQRHKEAYTKRSHLVQPLPGARELLAYLTESGIPWAIATSGRMETARPNIERLGVDVDKAAVVTRDQVRYAKPDPDLFLEAARRINVPIENCAVVGDSIWDLLAARRASALGIGLLSGGYGQDELERASAYRVYEDPADMLKHIDEVGDGDRQMVETFTVPARKGRAARLTKGQAIKIINTHGSQVCDTWAFSAEDLKEFLSVEHMRPTLGSIFPKKGQALHTNRRRPILIMEEDTSPGIHDTLMAACDDYRYGLLGCKDYHDNCTDNLLAGMRQIGLNPPEVPSPVNLWMNIPVGPDGATQWGEPVSKPGDYVILRAVMDCIVAMSSCPQDMLPINGKDCVVHEVHYQILS